MLYIALIHNQEANRIATARQCATLLAELVGKDCSVHEFFWQPNPLQKTQIHKLLAADLRFCSLLANWSKYLGRKYYGWFSATKFFLRVRLPDYLVWSRLNARCRRRSIEISLTAKHIQAWEGFLQSDARYLVVMESDVALAEATKERLENELLPLLANESLGDALYVDLAGGCSEKELGCSHLNEDLVPGFVRYKKAITNTTCCYAINKKLASKYVAALWRNPGWRTINSDWLMNQLLVEVGNLGERVACYHARPPVFKHGSVEAVYASEIR